MRHLSLIDNIILQADHALRTVIGKPKVTERPNPAKNTAEAELTEQQRKHAAGLMRVNHCGEISAQALYQGQAT